MIADFLQTFFASASWDKGELVSCCGQKVKRQGHSVTNCVVQIPFLYIPSGRKHTEVDAVNQVLTV